jgi:diguanylate cyclase (GGDEF) domain
MESNNSMMESNSLIMESNNFKFTTIRKNFKSEALYLKTHDEITGLFNRSYLKEELRKLDSDGRYPFSVVIVDINGLKIINEVFGFDIGDRLLKKTADAIAHAAGVKSIAARWGGDEFAVIFPDTDENNVEKKCRRILNECRRVEEKHIKPSVALGNATKNDELHNINHILVKAEDRLYRSKLLETQSTRSSIITSLSKALFQKSSETEEHAQRIRNISLKVGKAIGLSRDEQDELSLLSILHDIGKIAITDKILSKPGKLSDDEWDEMKRHSEIGYNIASASNELSTIAEYILSHHERWDGKGYPQGLKGSEIPKLSRIVSIVDTYDAITNERPYKVALSHSEALQEIKRCSGTQFDPDIAETFYHLFPKAISKPQNMYCLFK